jgi:hypothetical protein
MYIRWSVVDVAKYNKTDLWTKLTHRQIQNESITWKDGYVQCTYKIHYSVYYYVTILEMYYYEEHSNMQTIFHGLWSRREFE